MPKAEETLTIQETQEIIDLLEMNARRPLSELAAFLNTDEATVDKKIKKLEAEKIILGYSPVIDREKINTNAVTAIIEVNLTPEREVGFDKIAERIYRFEEVKTVYLMSGGFDLLVIMDGQTLKEVSNFIATRLATIAGVTKTRTHFMLKQYKKDGIISNDIEQDRRLVVSP